MADIRTQPRTDPEGGRDDRSESIGAAAFQGGNRVPALTVTGQEMNAEISEQERVTAVPKTPGELGNQWQSSAHAPNATDIGGYGTEEEETHPSDRPHAGGSPLLDGDAQYGASPLRTARYDQNHEAIRDIADGKRRSGHHGAQARYPDTDDTPADPSTGHDEQQMSTQMHQEMHPSERKDDVATAPVEAGEI